MWNITIIDHIGKGKYFARVVFFVPFLSISIRVTILKEGDRVGHKDDVLMDGSCFIKIK